MQLEEGALYRVVTDLGDGRRARTVIRRRFPDGRPSVYYAEDDIEEEYGNGLNVSAADVRSITVCKGKISSLCSRTRGNA